MAPPPFWLQEQIQKIFEIFYRDVIFRAVRHLFEGIAIRQEEAREKNLSPPEFKVPYTSIWPYFYISCVDPDST
jgi:hypothetical protein